MPKSALQYSARLQNTDWEKTSLICAICEEIVNDPAIAGKHTDLTKLAQVLRAIKVAKGAHPSVDEAIRKVAQLIRDNTPSGSYVHERQR